MLPRFGSYETAKEKVASQQAPDRDREGRCTSEDRRCRANRPSKEGQGISQRASWDGEDRRRSSRSGALVRQAHGCHGQACPASCFAKANQAWLAPESRGQSEARRARSPARAKEGGSCQSRPCQADQASHPLKNSTEDDAYLACQADTSGPTARKAARCGSRNSA